MSNKITTKAELEDFFCHHYNDLNTWIDVAQSKLPMPLTSSVDIRESKFKFAPVDHNMYPAGFNNLCSKDMRYCQEYFREAFDRVKPGLKKIGLLSESHTKNKFYLDHLFYLSEAMGKAGAEVTIFSPDQTLFEEGKLKAIELLSHSEHKIVIHQAKVMDGVFVGAEDGEKFDFELILLNNDQSSPLAIAWSDLKTPVMPSPFVGWYQRQKIHHFAHYERVAKEFASAFSIDPDLISARFSSVDHVDFNTKDGIEPLALEVESVLSKLPDGSSVFVKASQGTYGMGISVVSSGEEIRSMNRKGRNKMDIGKNNLKFTKVLIQEGVETILKYDEAPAEVTIYLIDGKSAGGFLRTNPLRTSQSNLNAQGMVYRKFCISEIRQSCDHQIKEAVYSVLGRLSTLAAAHEMKDLLK